MSKLKIVNDGLTFDDVLLIPHRSNVQSRRDVDAGSQLSRRIKINIPIVSANMDTVTESAMAIAIAREGGMGIIHRFMSIDEQVSEVLKVKRSESAVIEEPFTLTSDKPLRDALSIMRSQNISGILIVDEDRRVVGILTSRDVLFEDNLDMKISELMTRKMITGPVGISLDEAKKILHAHRIEKLPLVDGKGILKGLMTVKDIIKRDLYPGACKDGKGRLRVGAAIGVKGNYLERAEALLKVGVDLLAIDIAHGHSENAIRAVKTIRSKLGDVQLMAGNVATREGVRDLVDAGVDSVKVGVGPGSICVTRVVTGAGVPQLTAIIECAEEAQKHNVPIIADGGIRSSGDITKALAAGANSVMIGNLLAGTEESPGVTIIRNGAKYKVSRGMASLGATAGRKMREEGEDEDEIKFGELTPEGVEAMVPYRGKVSEAVNQLMGGLRSGMSYCGARNIRELQENASFIKISDAGFREGLPHDVEVVK